MAFPSHICVGRPRTEKSDMGMYRRFLLRVQRVCGDQCSPVVQDEGHALRSPPQHRPQWTQRDPLCQSDRQFSLGHTQFKRKATEGGGEMKVVNSQNLTL